ncbi:MAG: hypothetical protein KGL39_24745 [Patescibacteria group bacterium]|nr:hypothetical protein [Patescibacteria group bacterium]
MSLRTALQDYLKELNTDLDHLISQSNVADLRREIRAKDFAAARDKAEALTENLTVAEELSSVIDCLSILLETNDDVDEEDLEDEDFSDEELDEAEEDVDIEEY